MKVREWVVATSTGGRVCINFYSAMLVQLIRNAEGMERTSCPVNKPTVQAPISPKSGWVPSSSHWMVHFFEASHVVVEEGLITCRIGEL